MLMNTEGIYDTLRLSVRKWLARISSRHHSISVRLSPMSKQLLLRSRFSPDPSIRRVSRGKRDICLTGIALHIIDNISHNDINRKSGEQIRRSHSISEHSITHHLHQRQRSAELPRFRVISICLVAQSSVQRCWWPFHERKDSSRSILFTDMSLRRPALDSGLWHSGTSLSLTRARHD
jgi:hypothetical protein